MTEKIICPNCNKRGKLLERDIDSEGIEITEEYECRECGCEWYWEMERYIREEGEEVEG